MNTFQSRSMLASLGDYFYREGRRTVTCCSNNHLKLKVNRADRSVVDYNDSNVLWRRKKLQTTGSTDHLNNKLLSEWALKIQTNSLQSALLILLSVLDNEPGTWSQSSLQLTFQCNIMKWNHPFMRLFYFVMAESTLREFTTSLCLAADQQTFHGPSAWLHKNIFMSPCERQSCDSVLKERTWQPSAGWCHAVVQQKSIMDSPVTKWQGTTLYMNIQEVQEVSGFAALSCPYLVEP